MTVKERLHNLIDRLPEEAAERIEPDIRKICEENDPVWKAFMEAPEVDEPFTEEEEEMIREAEEAIERGECESWETVHARLRDGTF